MKTVKDFWMRESNLMMSYLKLVSRFKNNQLSMIELQMWIINLGTYLVQNKLEYLDKPKTTPRCLLCVKATTMNSSTPTWSSLTNLKCKLA